MNPATHDQWTFTPPHGTRFSIYGSDVQLQFEKRRTDEMLAWLKATYEAAVSMVAQRKMDAPVNPVITEEAPPAMAPSSTASTPGLVMQTSEAQMQMMRDRAALLIKQQETTSSPEATASAVQPLSELPKHINAQTGTQPLTDKPSLEKLLAESKEKTGQVEQQTKFSALDDG